jgi:glycosyltransferase involved in cell wall biosynthesis
MRVLHVNSGNLFGGVETLLVTLARERGLCPDMEPAFAVCFGGKLEESLDAAGVAVHRLGDVRVRRPWTVWQARRRFAALLHDKVFDVVVCHAAWVQAIFGPVVRRAGLPLVFWLHDPPGGRLHWLERWARRTPPDLAVCNSDYTRQRLARLYPHVPAERVYCPVTAPAEATNAAERDAFRSGHSATPATTVIVQAGRIARHKGHLLHLEALGRLRDVPGWVCWQVGGPQTVEEKCYLAEMQAGARRWGIADRVRFLGWQSDLQQVLAAADVFCQPNILPEPFGIALVEALYTGLPVVTTAMGGAVEIVHDPCGVLVPSGDVEGLAAALAALHASPERRQRARDAGPVRAAELCDPAAQLPRLGRALQRVVRPSSPRFEAAHANT